MRRQPEKKRHGEYLLVGGKQRAVVMAEVRARVLLTVEVLEVVFFTDMVSFVCG